MSEADARVLSSLSQESTHSESPFCMETNSTASDLPQNKTKREDKCKLSLSEEIYSTLDSVLGDIHVGHGSPVSAQPVNTHTSPAHQYGHLCKLHRLQAFHDEMATFQHVADGSPYAEGPVCADAAGHSGEDCSFKEDGPEQSSTPISENLLAHACVWQPPRNRPQAHSWGDSLEAAPSPTQPGNYLSKVTDFSQEVQKPRASAERAAGHPQEARDDGKENSRGPSTWSPAGTSCSWGVSRQEGPASDSEGSRESLPWAEEGLALNEALRQLRRANREQHSWIQSLQSSNVHLEEKVRELQARAAKQCMLMDVIGKLKENVETLIEDKYRVMLEKNEVEHTLQDLHRVLANTQKHLQESRNDKETLELELKKVQASYVHLQEKYVAEVQLSEPLSPSAERDRSCSQREEAERLQQLQGELERSASCTQHLLQSEKEAREQELLALQEALWQHQQEDLEEREKVQSRLELLGAQLQSLQCLSEKEAKQATLDCVQDAEQPTEVPLNPSPGQEGCPVSPDTRRASQLAAKIHGVLGLMLNLLSPQGSSSPKAADAGWHQDIEREGESTVQKLEHFLLKKKHLDKELLRHKQRIMVFRQSVANRKASQWQAQVTSFDSTDVRSIREIPVLLEAKLDKYHLLNQELDFLIAKLGSLLESKEDHCNRLIEENNKYQRHLGSLIDKVESYEEIIECADHRLAVSRSQITHLEERNRHLEDLMRRPRERTRKLRLRGLEAQPRSTGRGGQ